AAAPAANPVVWFDHDKSGIAAADQTAIRTLAHSKYEFTAGGFNVGTALTFTEDLATPGITHEITFDNKETREGYGRTPAGTEHSYVYRKLLTDGAFRAFFNTNAKQNNSMAETAAHELAHQICPAMPHNSHAPAREDEEEGDINGKKVLAARLKGDGTLVGGKPGLFADGRHVLAAEHAADERIFTDREKQQIADNVKKLSEGKKVGFAPSGSDRDIDVRFVRGVRYDETDDGPQPPWSEPFPLTRSDDHVDVSAVLGNNALWDFGYATEDGGFVPVIYAGEATGGMSIAPGAIVHFAIRPYGLPDEARLTMADVGTIPLMSDPVDPSKSVLPMLDGTYFRMMRLEFDTDGNPGTLPVSVTIQADPLSVDYYDGFYALPEPTTAVLLAVGALAAARRRSGRMACKFSRIGGRSGRLSRRSRNDN
ncbi:MAG: hypothetical protein HY718_17685, partial [Planctomycetes bacterium]|nr:hypothetical protein [Planctomycetota bacterium]